MKKIFLPTISAALLLCAMTLFASAPAQAATDAQTLPASDARVTKLSPQIKAQRTPAARMIRPVPQIMKELGKLSLIVRVSTFQVNEQMPAFKCTTFIIKEESGFERIHQVSITEAESGALVQKIELPIEYQSDEYENFMKSPVYFIDVTFDGNLDLLISRQWCARYISFDVFFWDVKSQQFRQDPYYTTLSNPAIDPVNKCIYTTIQGDSMTYYDITVFTNNHFVITHSFSSRPEGSVADKPYTVRYKEYRYDFLTNQDILVNDFCVLADDYYGPAGYDDADPLLKPYFKPGSFWDLRSDKWRSALWQEFIY